MKVFKRSNDIKVVFKALMLNIKRRKWTKFYQNIFFPQKINKHGVPNNCVDGKAARQLINAEVLIWHVGKKISQKQ